MAKKAKRKSKAKSKSEAQSNKAKSKANAELQQQGFSHHPSPAGSPSEGSSDSDNRQTADEIDEACRKMGGQRAELNGEDLYRNALVNAAWDGHLGNLFWLLDGGADPNMADDKGDVALIEAADENNVAAARILLDSGASLGHMSASHGFTALMAAAYYDPASAGLCSDGTRKVPHGSTVGVLRLLLQRGADVDQIGCLSSGYRAEMADVSAFTRTHTAFLCACLAGREEAVKILVMAGSDTTFKTSQEQTAFYKILHDLGERAANLRLGENLRRDGARNRRILAFLQEHQTRAGRRRAGLTGDAYLVGAVVTVNGLVSAREHNGKRAGVLAHSTARGRYSVELLGSGIQLRVRPANVHLLHVAVGGGVFLRRNEKNEHLGISGMHATVVSRCGDAYLLRLDSDEDTTAVSLSEIDLLDSGFAAPAAVARVQPRTVRHTHLRMPAANMPANDPLAAVLSVGTILDAVLAGLGVPALWRCCRVSRSWKHSAKIILVNRRSPLVLGGFGECSGCGSVAVSHFSQGASGNMRTVEYLRNYQIKAGAGGQRRAPCAVIGAVEALDWSTLDWSRRANMQYPRQRFAACALPPQKSPLSPHYREGGIAVFGVSVDTNSDSETWETSVEESAASEGNWLRCPSHRSWTKSVSIPDIVDEQDRQIVRLEGARACVIEGGARILVIGGIDTDACYCTALATVHSFDTHQEKWQQIAPMRQARADFAAAVLRDGRVIVAGGMKHEDTPPTTPFEGCDAELFLCSAEIFDPMTGFWSDLPPMSMPRWSCSGTLAADGTFVVAGGAAYRPRAEPHQVTNDGWRIFSVPGTGPGSVPDRSEFMSDGADWCLFDSCEAYDPALNEWRAFPKLPHATHRHAMCTTEDGQMLLTGGRQDVDDHRWGNNDGPFLSSVLIFDEDTQRWLRLGEMQRARADHLIVQPMGPKSVSERQLNTQPAAAAGLQHTLLTVRGQLYSCGFCFGALGHGMVDRVLEEDDLQNEITWDNELSGTQSNEMSPRLVEYFLHDEIVSIAAAETASAAVSASGCLYIWGENWLSWDEGISQTLPMPVVGPWGQIPVSMVSAGDKHIACVTESGNLYTWGTGDDAEDQRVSPLGHDFGADLLSPQQVEHVRVLHDSWEEDDQIKTTTFLAAMVSCGQSTTGVVTREGQLFLCGNTPRAQAESDHKYGATQIRAGRILDCAFGDWEWSNQSKPTSLDRRVADSASPPFRFRGASAPSLPGERSKGHPKIKSVSCAIAHFAAVSVDGVLFTWGAKPALGVLGHGIGMSSIPREQHRQFLQSARADAKTADIQVPLPYPTPVAFFAHKTVVSASCGPCSTAAITSDGKLYMWGSNVNGKLGNGKIQLTMDKDLGCLLPILVDLDSVANVRDSRAIGVACSTCHTVVTLASGEFCSFGAGDTTTHDGSDCLIHKSMLGLGLPEDKFDPDIETELLIELRAPNNKIVLTPHKMVGLPFCAEFVDAACESATELEKRRSGGVSNRVSWVDWAARQGDADGFEPSPETAETEHAVVVLPQIVKNAERKRDAVRRRKLDGNAAVVFERGDEVRVQLLTGRPELNGKLGVVQSFKAASLRSFPAGRYKVQLEGVAKPLGIKALNLQHIDVNEGWSMDSEEEVASEEAKGEESNSVLEESLEESESRQEDSREQMQAIASVAESDAAQSPVLGVLECSGCKSSLPKTFFSKTQAGRKPATKRKCKACVSAETIAPKSQIDSEALHTISTDEPRRPPVEPPAEYICPISHELMVDPVFTASGQTYERECIALWLRSKQTDPISNAGLPNKKLVPNFALRGAITQWKVDHQKTPTVAVPSPKTEVKVVSVGADVASKQLGQQQLGPMESFATPDVLRWLSTVAGITPVEKASIATKLATEGFNGLDLLDLTERSLPRLLRGTGADRAVALVLSSRDEYITGRSTTQLGLMENFTTSDVLRWLSMMPGLTERECASISAKLEAESYNGLDLLDLTERSLPRLLRGTAGAVRTAKLLLSARDEYVVGHGVRDDVAALLDRLGLSEHLPLCDENEMDMESLRLCELADLDEIGMPLSAARQILAHLGKAVPPAAGFA